MDLDWRIAEEDLAGMRRSLELLGAELGRAGLGRIWVPTDEPITYRPLDIMGGCHQMGTTRMSASTEDGVVSEVRVALGEQVESGALLLTVEPASGDSDEGPGES